MICKIEKNKIKKHKKTYNPQLFFIKFNKQTDIKSLSDCDKVPEHSQFLYFSHHKLVPNSSWTGIRLQRLYLEQDGFAEPNISFLHEINSKNRVCITKNTKNNLKDLLSQSQCMDVIWILI